MSRARIICKTHGNLLIYCNCYHPAVDYTKKEKTGKLFIEFTDGTTKEINLGTKCIEINLPQNAKQSLSINQGKNGFILSFTKHLMDGKQFKEIKIVKE